MEFHHVAVYLLPCRQSEVFQAEHHLVVCKSVFFIYRIDSIAIYGAQLIISQLHEIEYRQCPYILHQMSIVALPATTRIVEVRIACHLVAEIVACIDFRQG